MTSNGNLKLVFVKPNKKNVEGHFEYDLFFSSNPEVVWGVFWDDNNPSQCGDMLPEKTSYNEIVKIDSPYELSTIQEFSCFSMEHAVNNIIALAWININVLEEFPEHRIVLHFGDNLEYIESQLNKMDIYFKN